MKVTRVVLVVASSALMLPTMATAASAHVLMVKTPSGQSTSQVLHSGNTGLPPHSGAFKYHVTCNVNPANPAISITGPSSCTTE